MNPLFDLRGKVAVITGSTRGIGRAIAEEMGQAGARVVVSSEDAEATARTAGELREAGIQTLAVPCHIGDRAQLKALVEQTMAHWGRIDALVCNAAINPVYGPLAQLSEDAFVKVMDTNVNSAFSLCQAALPHMAAGGGGTVVLVSSIGAFRGSTALGVYGVSKTAELGLMRSLAVEWGPRNIRVNAIAPGLVRTQFSEVLTRDPERLRRAEERTPLRRIGEPRDIAGVALFLAAPASAYITGQTIVADGGELVS
ncbi:MAG TPA: SDR family oxidoreductase [Pseudorhodoferax sp.]|jgi:NAD(P)-dependent dehydrogenase (short-subunit alcohol dehydrogenase family)|nr:SDR family oxidoreductase [Pseudorhodoferax sp.]